MEPIKEVSLKDLRRAVKAFNDCPVRADFLDRKVNPVQKFDALREAFLEAVEMIPEDREQELPDIVVETYNALVQVEESVEEVVVEDEGVEDVKEEEKIERAEPKSEGKKQKKAEGKSVFGHTLGTQAARIDELISEGKCTSFKEIADEVGCPVSRVKSHIRHLKEKRGIVVEVKDGKVVFYRESK